MGKLGYSVAGVVSALSFVGIGFAFLGAPQLLTRFMAAKDRNEIVQGSLIAIVCIIVFDTGAVLAGMAGRAVFPGLANPETILPTMLSTGRRATAPTYSSRPRGEGCEARENGPGATMPWNLVVPLVTKYMEERIAAVVYTQVLGAQNPLRDKPLKRQRLTLSYRKFRSFFYESSNHRVQCKSESAAIIANRSRGFNSNDTHGCDGFCFLSFRYWCRWLWSNIRRHPSSPPKTEARGFSPSHGS